MTKTITTILSENFFQNLKKIAKVEKVDRSTAIRGLLANAIEEWKKQHALEKYKKEEFSLRERENSLK